MKMVIGLRDNIDTLQQEKELLCIEQIYRKYSLKAHLDMSQQTF